MKALAMIFAVACMQPLDLGLDRHEISPARTVWCGVDDRELVLWDKVYDAKIVGNVLTAHEDIQYVYVIPAGVTCTIENWE